MTTTMDPIQPVPEPARRAARMLADADYLTSIDDVLDFFTKPHKWEAEVALWRDAGEPAPEDDGWRLFEARLDRREASQ